MKLLKYGSYKFSPSQEDCKEIKRVFIHYNDQREIKSEDDMEGRYFALQDTWHYFRARYSDLVAQYRLRSHHNETVLIRDFLNVCRKSSIPVDEIMPPSWVPSFGDKYPYWTI